MFTFNKDFNKNSRKNRPNYYYFIFHRSQDLEYVRYFNRFMKEETSLTPFKR